MGADDAVVRSLTDAASDHIWNTYRGYTSEMFDRAELDRFVRLNVVVALACLERDANPSSSELDHARELGELRARQGVPLESVIQAFRSTERVLLLHVQTTRTTVAGTGPIERALSCFDALTNSMIDAYREASSMIDAVSRRAEDELAAALTRGWNVDQRDLDRWADALDVDADSDYLCVVFESVGTADPLAGQQFRRRVVTGLAGNFGPVVSRAGDDLLVVFVPIGGNRTVNTLIEDLGRLVAATGCSAAYVGDTVESLAHGHESYLHAMVVRQVARRHVTHGTHGPDHRSPVWVYGDVLLDVLLGSDPATLARFTAGRIGALRGKPQLLDTVMALAATNLSQTRAASMLFVHVNTVALRVKRIEELTGLSPLVFTHLVELYLATRAGTDS